MHGLRSQLDLGLAILPPWLFVIISRVSRSIGGPVLNGSDLFSKRELNAISL